MENDFIAVWIIVISAFGLMLSIYMNEKDKKEDEFNDR